jgi:hypothetical protein
VWPTPRSQGKRLAASVIVLAAYGAAREPTLRDGDRARLAAQFEFSPVALRELSGLPRQTSRVITPSMDRLSAWASSLGAAVALADLDGDGLPNDVCQVDPRVDRVLIAPVPGTASRYAPFVLPILPAEPQERGSAPTGCVPGDLNEDGRMDVLVYYFGRGPVAFLRRENGPLASDGFAARPISRPAERWYTNAVALTDLDGDGHVDLVVGNYPPDGSWVLDPGETALQAMPDSLARARNGGTKHFLLWTGSTGGQEPGVTFKEVDLGLGPALARGWAVAAGAADLDGDLRPELYFANDFGPDQLLHNESTPGHPRFTAVFGERHLTTPKSKVLGVDSFKGMGVDFADLNGDGWPDIFVSNLAAPYGLEESHFAYVSTGDVGKFSRGLAPYVDASESLGLARSGWAWDAKLADFNNDLAFEVIQANGFIQGTTSRWPELHELGMTNDTLLADPRHWPRLAAGDALSGHDRLVFFARSPGGRYHDVAAQLGLAMPYVSRGIAVADVDGDGRLEFAVANQWAPSFLMLNRTGHAGQFLGLRILHSTGAAGSARVLPERPAGVLGSPAVGAAVEVTLPSGRRLSSQLDGGSGHSGKRSPELHFGLGDVPPQRELPVEIRWRGRDGTEHRTRLTLSPGWHTILLGGRLEGHHDSHGA